MINLTAAHEILEYVQHIRRIIESDDSGILNVVDVYVDQIEDELNTTIDDREENHDYEADD